MTNSIQTAIILSVGTNTPAEPSQVHNISMLSGGKIFIENLLDQLYKYGIQKVFLPVVYKYHLDKPHNKKKYEKTQLKYVEKMDLDSLKEDILSSLSENEHLLILKETALFHIDLQDFIDDYFSSLPNVSCALKWKSNCSDFYTVVLENKSITSIREKSDGLEGFVNTGIYIISRPLVSQLINYDHQVFEESILMKEFSNLNIRGYPSLSFFIDIEIPNQLYLFDWLSSHSLKTWDLFLDRDGVINTKLDDHYIRNWKDFEFTSGLPSCFPVLNKVFKKIFVVTNQQGVGKGLMTRKDLYQIHENMEKAIAQSGGTLSKIYACPDLASASNNCRKPSKKLADLAQADFPEICFTKCLMIGDSECDRDFAKNTGMKFIRIQEPLSIRSTNLGVKSEIHMRNLKEFCDLLEDYYKLK